MRREPLISNGFLKNLKITDVNINQTYDMKHLLLTLLGICFSQTIFSQSLYRLWVKAGKDQIRNEIRYANDIKVEIDTVIIKYTTEKERVNKWTPPLSSNKKYRRLAKKQTPYIKFKILKSNKYRRLAKKLTPYIEYNPQNDTLLFVFYHRYRWPSWIFVYTKDQQKAFLVTAKDKSLEEISKPDRPWNDETMFINEALFQGRIDQVLEYLTYRGYVMWDARSLFAWRIIFHDGKIIYPTYYWRFENMI